MLQSHQNIITWQLNESTPVYSPFSLGVNWELSDLMLQFKTINTPDFVEEAFITRTGRNLTLKMGTFLVFMLPISYSFKKFPF